jgi:hypothetical protein
MARLVVKNEDAKDTRFDDLGVLAQLISTI